MYLIVGNDSQKEKIRKLESYFQTQKTKSKSLIFENLKEATLYVEANWEQYEQIIFLDKYAIFPFMYLSKVHKLVVARVTDFYSAYMTPLHNNTKVIVIPTSIIADEYIAKLSIAFIKANFEAGRHMVRIDMLNKETQ